VVLMIGGGIPGKTEVVSIHIYHLVEALQWERAHVLAAALSLFGFAIMLTFLLLERRFARLSV
jgi:molybdate transport system permease protein